MRWKAGRWSAALALTLGLMLMDARGRALAAHPGQAALVAQVAAESGKDPASLNRLLDGAHRQQKILDTIRRPAESKPWYRYRPIFLTAQRIQDGVAFYRQHRVLLGRISQRYQVDPAYLVAIIGVETGYGRNTGSFKVLDALATLGFYYSDNPARQHYFLSQLKTLLELPSSYLGGPLPQLMGSYAGAQGWPQFMPDSIREYGVDADGDGRIDLAHSVPDILASVANYFHGHGWQRGGLVALPARAAAAISPIQASDAKPRWTLQQLAGLGYTPAWGRHSAATPSTLVNLQRQDGPEYWIGFQNFYVITRYNRSPLYAMAVYQLAQAITRGLAAGQPR